MTLDHCRPPRSVRRGGYTISDLVADLKRMGVRPGDVLIVHSSMKSLGHVHGGPESLIAALQRAVGPRGTIVMTAFSYTFDQTYWPVAPFDPRIRSGPGADTPKSWPRLPHRSKRRRPCGRGGVRPSLGPRS